MELAHFRTPPAARPMAGRTPAPGGQCQLAATSRLCVDDIMFETEDVAISANHSHNSRGADAKIVQGHLTPHLVFESDWCSAHHLMAGTLPHRVCMERYAHTLLIFDGGSYSEGERRIDGTRFGPTGPLDAGVDVIPAKSRLVAWSGEISNIGVTLITLDCEQFGEILGEQVASTAGLGMRPEVNMRNELLSPLVARVRRWSMVEEAGCDSVQRETILMLIVQEIMRMQRLQSPQSAALHRGGLSPRAQRMLREFVAGHLDERIDLQTLADLVGMSRFHFSRAFKVSFGLPPHKHLMSERIRVAAEKMRATHDSITDIALQVGFSCSSELTRLFKQTVGCTPREFRSDQRMAVPAAIGQASR
ncbi:helix-turn-helix transcriptional regulator [Cupriavidus necator]